MSSFKTRSSLGITATSLLAVLGLAACAAERVDDGTLEEGAPTQEEGPAESSSGGTVGNDEPSVIGDQSVGMVDGEEPEPERCLTAMTWGAAGKLGSVPGEAGMDAVAAWLNESSTADASHLIEKPEIRAELLEGVDLLLLHDLSRWELSDDEVDVVEAWVRAGGGLLSLSGFRDDGAEVPPTNRLVSFSGMSYVSQSGVGDTALTLGDCAYCLASTHRQQGWNEEHPIAQGITQVGAFQGRSIQGGGEVVAREEGLILGMTAEVDEGRVFLFHDDWVSFRGQWDADAPTTCRENPECTSVSPRTSYQMAQFWYNAIVWLVPGRECFSISDETLVR